MPRHGRNHSIPPHLINYRANILGLKRLGVTAILSTTAVGSLNRDDKPGDFVLPDQFLDFTKCRHTSFFDGGENGVVHVPEVCLAREAEICYATISMVTNFAAGISPTPLTHEEVVKAMAENSQRLQQLILKSIELYDNEDCACRHPLQAYGGFTV